MKALIAFAGAAAGVTMIHNASTIEPDAHAGLWGDCTGAYESNELAQTYVNRALCQLSRAFPYDSVGCFINAWRGVEVVADEDITAEPDAEIDVTATDIDTELLDDQEETVIAEAD